MGDYLLPGPNHSINYQASCEQRLVHATQAQPLPSVSKKLSRLTNLLPCKRWMVLTCNGEDLAAQICKFLMKIRSVNRAYSGTPSAFQPSFPRPSLSWYETGCLLIDSALINSPSRNVAFRSILQEIGNVSPLFAKCMTSGSLGGLFPNSETYL